MDTEKETDGWEKYNQLKKDDWSVNKKYWDSYGGISEKLAFEIPSERLLEVVSNFADWIGGDSFDEELHQKLMALPEEIRNAHLVYSYECEMNGEGFDGFYFNFLGYEVFEIEKALDFFGLKKNKRILHDSLKLLGKKIDLKDYQKLSASRELPEEELEDEFSNLDSRFYKYPEDIKETVSSHLEKNRDKLVTLS